MIKYPCKNCNDRAVGCHGTCNKYKAKKLEQKLANERKLSDMRVTGYQVTSVRRSEYISNGKTWKAKG